MDFNVFIEESRYRISVAPQDIASGHEMFHIMDQDMDGGWRLGPEFVHHPDHVQRVQIVAERLMLAMEARNTALQAAMAAYIVRTIPDISELHIDTTGDPSLTEIITY